MRLIQLLGTTIIGSMTLTACSSSPEPTPVPKKVEPVKVAAKLNPATPLKGQLNLKKQSATFTPCGGETQYWVELSASDRQLLQGFAKPSQAYVEFSARFDNVSKQAPQADYPAKVIPLEWQYVAAEGLGCQKEIDELSAWGNEPDWHIDIQANQIKFSTPSSSVSKTISRSGIDQGLHYWQSSDELLLEVTQQRCLGTMVNSVYSYSAKFSYQGKNYQGCARRPFTQDIAALAGYYQVKLPTASGSGRVVDLSLKPDFSAELQTTYLEPQKSFTEKGYWFPINNKQLSFTVSQSGQKQVKSSMLFNWDGRILQLQNPASHQQGNVGLNMIKMSGPAVASSSPNNSYTARSFEPATLLASSDYDPQVEAALKHYFKLHRTELNGTKYQWWKFDLNGDGQDEIISYVDWCGSGGCSLLIFEGKDNRWRFLSKTTLVRTPFYLARSSHAHWQDLLLEVSGGGVQAGLRLLRFDGLSYPLNPSMQPEAPQPAPLSGVTFHAEAFGQGAGRALK